MIYLPETQRNFIGEKYENTNVQQPTLTRWHSTCISMHYYTEKKN